MVGGTELWGLVMSGSGREAQVGGLRGRVRGALSNLGSFGQIAKEPERINGEVKLFEWARGVGEKVVNQLGFVGPGGDELKVGTLFGVVDEALRGVADELTAQGDVVFSEMLRSAVSDYAADREVERLRSGLLGASGGLAGNVRYDRANGTQKKVYDARIAGRLLGYFLKYPTTLAYSGLLSLQNRLGVDVTKLLDVAKQVRLEMKLS